MPEYTISWSGGKDSTATVILAHEHNVPVKQILTVDIMYDETHSAVPIIDEFKNECIKRFENEFGYQVTRLKPTRTYKENFLAVRTRGKNTGKCRGHVIQGACDFTNEKMRALRKYSNEPQIIGIAIDEPIRLARIKEPNISLLAKYNMTESDAMELCKKYDMVSPLYGLGVTRDGCFFCPNGITKTSNSLKLLYDYDKDLYNDFKSFVLENMDKAVSKHFNRKYDLDDIFRITEEETP